MSEEQNIDDSFKMTEDSVEQTTDNSPSSTEEQPETLTTNSLQPTTQNMEVHHHPQLHHKEKPWKEYILEYIMIVLAVATGFFAESIRENISDREKEKQNIENIVKCLATDTTELKKIIAINIRQLNYVDSLMQLKGLNLSEIENNKKFYVYTLTGIYGDWFFKPNDAAMQQLKASGSLRLIRKQAVIDSLFQYDRYNAVMKDQQEICYYLMKNEWMKFEAIADESEFMNKNKFESGMENGYLFYRAKYSEPLYISKDEKELRLFYGNAATYGPAIGLYIILSQQQLQYAKSTIEFIKKEYHLNHE
ncbi:MAG: hypothetical protein JSR11_12820 [Bacteroidetes bacterium]|nr:hypothetical protein [Bacteroidota bacterium]